MVERAQIINTTTSILENLADDSFLSQQRKKEQEKEKIDSARP